MGCLKRNWCGTICLLAMLVLVTVSCREKPVTEKVYPLITLSNNFEDPATVMRKTGDTPQGEAFTHAEGDQHFTAGIVYQVPDTLLHQDIRVIVSCHVRKGCRDGGHSLVVSMQNDSSTVIWEALEADRYVYSNDKWALLKDSFQILSDINTLRGMQIRAYGWNPRSSCYIDLDDLKIELKKVIQMPPRPY